MMLEKFIEENFERDVYSFVEVKKLHKMYLEFARENGLEKITQTKLTRYLNVLDIGAAREKGVNGKKLYVRYGLKVK